MVVMVVIPEERVTIMNSSFCEIKRQPLTCYIISFCIPPEILRKFYLKSLKPVDAIGCRGRTMSRRITRYDKQERSKEQVPGVDFLWLP